MVHVVTNMSKGESESVAVYGLCRMWRSMSDSGPGKSWLRTCLELEWLSQFHTLPVQITNIAGSVRRLNWGAVSNVLSGHKVGAGSTVGRRGPGDQDGAGDLALCYSADRRISRSSVCSLTQTTVRLYGHDLSNSPASNKVIGLRSWKSGVSKNSYLTI